jgi:hypothetical protein
VLVGLCWWGWFSSPVPIRRISPISNRLSQSYSSTPPRALGTCSSPSLQGTSLQLDQLAVPRGPHLPAQRARWALYLSKLVPYPTAIFSPGTANATTIWADASLAGDIPPDALNNADYQIAHYAAIVPAQLVGRGSPPAELELAWRTVKIVNDHAGWITSGGLDMNFVAAARVVPKAEVLAAHPRYGGADHGLASCRCSGSSPSSKP